MTDEARFTIAEATALLPELQIRLERLQAARRQLVEAAEQVTERASHNGAAKTPPARGDAADLMREELDIISGWGVVVRDVDTGLVDFPGEREGTSVWLCWRTGEDAVAFWHPLETGFGSRQPWG